jgi:hypothetical protein
MRTNLDRLLKFASLYYKLASQFEEWWLLPGSNIKLDVPFSHNVKAIEMLLNKGALSSALRQQGEEMGANLVDVLDPAAIIMLTDKISPDVFVPAFAKALDIEDGASMEAAQMILEDPSHGALNAMCKFKDGIRVFNNAATLSGISQEKLDRILSLMKESPKFAQMVKSDGIYIEDIKSGTTHKKTMNDLFGGMNAFQPRRTSLMSIFR